MFNKMNGITLFPSNDDLVQYYEMRKFKTISTNTYIFGVDEFQNSTNVFKHTLKTQDMSFKEKLILYSGMIIIFVNSVMKVDTPKKLMLDVTVILSWVDDNGVKKCIHEASVI